MAKFGKDPIYRTKVIMRKPVWTPAIPNQIKRPCALLCFIIILFIADKILWSKTSVRPRSLNSMKILDVIRRDCGDLCNTLKDQVQMDSFF